MKRLLTIFIAVFMLLGLTACAGNAPANTAESGVPANTDEKSGPAATDEPVSSALPETAGSAAEASTGTESESDGTPVSQESETAPEHRSILVVVFSATGTTKGVAEKIAAIEDADLYEITAAEPYSADDLNYNDRNSRTTLEQNDKSARPEIGSEPLDLSGYTTVYLGFPIWWGEEPRILDTFVESYDFDGITVIPFCTSGSSGIGRSGQNLADNAGSGNWLEGKRFSGSVTEADLQAWIDGLK